MASKDTRTYDVIYRAKADFSELVAAVAAARTLLRSLAGQQNDLGKANDAIKQGTNATSARTSATSAAAKATKDYNDTLAAGLRAEQAQQDAAKATTRTRQDEASALAAIRRNSEATRKQREAETKALKDQAESAKAAAKELERLNDPMAGFVRDPSMTPAEYKAARRRYKRANDPEWREEQNRKRAARRRGPEPDETFPPEAEDITASTRALEQNTSAVQDNARARRDLTPLFQAPELGGTPEPAQQPATVRREAEDTGTAADAAERFSGNLARLADRFKTTGQAKDRFIDNLARLSGRFDELSRPTSATPQQRTLARRQTARERDLVEAEAQFADVPDRALADRIAELRAELSEIAAALRADRETPADDGEREKLFVNQAVIGKMVVGDTERDQVEVDTSTAGSGGESVETPPPANTPDQPGPDRGDLTTDNISRAIQELRAAGRPATPDNIQEQLRRVADALEKKTDEPDPASVTPARPARRGGPAAGADRLAANLDKLAAAFDTTGEAKDRFIGNLGKLRKVFDNLAKVKLPDTTGTVAAAAPRRRQQVTEPVETTQPARAGRLRQIPDFAFDPDSPATPDPRLARQRQAAAESVLTSAGLTPIKNGLDNLNRALAAVLPTETSQLGRQRAAAQRDTDREAAATAAQATARLAKFSDTLAAAAARFAAARRPAQTAPDFADVIEDDERIGKGLLIGGRRIERAAFNPENALRPFISLITQAGKIAQQAEAAQIRDDQRVGLGLRPVPNLNLADVADRLNAGEAFTPNVSLARQRQRTEETQQLAAQRAAEQAERDAKAREREAAAQERAAAARERAEQAAARREEAEYRRRESIADRDRRRPLRTLGRTVLGLVGGALGGAVDEDDDRGVVRRAGSGFARALARPTRAGDSVTVGFRNQTRDVSQVANLSRGFVGAGDVVVAQLTRFSRVLFSWRGLIILAVAALGPLVAALGSVGGAALGAINGFASLVSSVAALPGLLASATAGFAALFTGLSPLGKVFDAYNKQQQAVEDNSKRTSTALRDQKRAYEDLQAAVDGADLSMEDANLSYEEALQRYRETLVDPNATMLQRQRAALSVKQADAARNTTATQNQRNAEDLAAANANGGVVPGQTNPVSDAQDEVDKARAKLGKNTLKVVDEVRALKGAFEDVQKDVGDELFEGLAKRVSAFPGLLRQFRDFILPAADALGVLAGKAVDLVRSGPFSDFFRVQAQENARLIEIFGQAVLDLASGMRGFTTATRFFTTGLATSIGNVARAFNDWANSVEGMKSIRDFLTIALGQIRGIGDIALNLIQFYGALYRASSTFTDGFIGALKDITAGWEDWAREQEKATSPLREFLKETRPLLDDIGRFLVAFGVAFAQMAADPRNIQEAQRIFRSLAEDVLPPLVGIFGKLAESGVISNVVQAIGNVLAAIESFLEAGGGTPLQAFVLTIELLSEALNGLLSVKPLAGILTVIATALGALAAASLFTKFSGLAKLGSLIGFLVTNLKGDGLGQRLRNLGKGVSDLFLGLESGTTASSRPAGAAAQTVAANALAAGALEPTAGTGGADATLLRIERQIAQIILLMRNAALTPGGGTTTVTGGGGGNTTVVGAPGGSSSTPSRRTPTPGSNAVGRTGGVGGAALALGSILPSGGRGGGVRDIEEFTRVAQTAGETAANAGTRAGRFSGTLGAIGDTAKGAGSKLGAVFARTGGFGAALAGLGAMQIIGATFGKDLRIQMDSFTQSLVEFGRTGQVTGETARVLGEGLENLEYDLNLADNSFLGQTGEGLARFTEAISGLGGVFDESVQHAEERTDALDAALAGLVQSGNLSEAEKVFARITEIAAKKGIDPKELEGLYDDYFNALNTVNPEVANAARLAAEQEVEQAKLARTLESRGLPATDAYMEALKVLNDETKTAADRNSALGTIWDEMFGAGLSLEERTLDYNEGLIDLRSSLEDAIKAGGAHAKSLDDQTQSGIDARRAILDQLAANRDLFIQEAAIPGNEEKARQAAKKRQQAIEDLATKLGINKTKLEELITTFGTYDQLPIGTKTVTIDTAETEENLARVEAALGRIQAAVALYETLPERTRQAIEGNGDPTNNLKTSADYNNGVPKTSGPMPTIPDYIPGSRFQNGFPGYQSGGVVAGAYAGVEDTVPAWLTAGEFVVRRRIVDQPGAKELLSAMNAGAVDPAQLYAGLNDSTVAAISATRVPQLNAPTSTVSNSTSNSAMNFGDIVIHNPVREPSDRSIRRSVAQLAYLYDR